MSQKISKLDTQNYNCLDFGILQSSLKEEDFEEMSELEKSQEEFKTSGSIPKKVAMKDIQSFGLRRAYFDIFKPSNPSTSGIWRLEKADDGSEWIVRSDGE